MVVWTALKSDVAHRSPDPKDRQAADDHMGLMTPVMKGVLTDVGSPTRCWRSRCMAAMATSPNRAWSSSCATPASP